MKVETSILFACARQRFTPVDALRLVDLCRSEEVRWPAVLRAAAQERVAPLVYTNLLKCAPGELRLPRDVSDEFARQLFSAISVSTRLDEAVDEAIAWLQANQCDVMLVKGVALGRQVYAQPWLALGSDADLVARGGSADRRRIAAGLERVNLRLREIGQLVEYQFDEHHDLTMNGVLAYDFGAVWHSAYSIRFGGRDVLSPSREDTLVFACVNACRKRFFRLKSLCDINEVVACWPDLDWGRVAQRARQFGCANIIFAALEVARETMGTAAPADIAPALGVSPPRAHVIRAIARGLAAADALPVLAHGSGPALRGRALNLSLLLPYAAYTPGQLRRKAAEFTRARHP